MVLGSFYYGYIVLQIPGGWLATKIGGTRIFGGALFFASVLTLLTPAAARFSVYALIVLRVLEGVALVSNFEKIFSFLRAISHVARCLSVNILVGGLRQ